jgi:Cd2+/Zn2+-exporting ATPase
LRDGEELSLDAEDVEVGDTVILRAGERVAVDCVVIQGQGDVDCSAVTGESVPVSVCEGMEICSGCVNISSQLIAKAVRTCENSAAARILSLVEEASDKKSKQEKFITSFSRYYTPIVVFCAVLLALVPPLFDGMSFSSWIHRALMFLVVSCPCALVISVPLSFFGGIGAAAKRGILYKGGSSFDAMRNVGTAVFDKTGTLTTGDFTVSGIYPCTNIDEDSLLALAAMAEHSSSHPIAKAVKKEYGKPTPPIEECKEIAGQGVIATIEGSVVRVGNHRLMQSAGIAYKSVESCCLHVSRDNEYLGYITVTDEVKREAKTALAELRSLGVKRIVMLTGDKSESAEKVAKELDIDEYHASLLPQDKYTILERELACAKGRVIFVGDGINDAPVIARADVGIAMGNVGSDAAIEASDVVIMSGNLDRLPEAVKIGKKTLRIATQNIFVAVGIKLAVLALCALGVIGMWWAVFADVGVAVVAILNSMRTLRYTPK